MLRAIAAYAFLSLLTLQAAQAETTFRLVSQASGKCLRLQAADQNDGGGLTMQDCKNYPDFFITGETPRTALSFQLNSSRSVCIFATDTPDSDPGGQNAKVMTRNCSGHEDSRWVIRSEDGGDFQKIEKLNGLDHTGFCMQENTETSEIELDSCHLGLKQGWKLEHISFPLEH